MVDHSEVVVRLVPDEKRLTSRDGERERKTAGGREEGENARLYVCHFIFDSDFTSSLSSRVCYAS